jgi:hypothetical protein
LAASAWRESLLHRFERERRKDRQLAARLGGDIGEHKELAPRVGPAGSFDNRPRRTISRMEPVESGISVGLENPRMASQMTLGMIASPIASIKEHRRRRIAASKGPIIANVGPKPSRHGLALGQHGHRRVVAVHPIAGEHMHMNQIMERP